MFRPQILHYPLSHSPYISKSYCLYLQNIPEFGYFSPPPLLPLWSISWSLPGLLPGLFPPSSPCHYTISYQSGSQSRTFKTCNFSAQSPQMPSIITWSQSPSPDSGCEGPTQSRPIDAFLATPWTPAHSALAALAPAVLEHTRHTSPTGPVHKLGKLFSFLYCLLLHNFLISAYVTFPVMPTLTTLCKTATIPTQHLSSLPF